VEILRAAAASGEVRCGPGDYVILNRRLASVRRSSKVIWELNASDLIGDVR
jgi:hypothetical protein